jgi:flavin reductase (DIM6/NTAB) family NADH-FMN oxidoreductase RutF
MEEQGMTQGIRDFHFYEPSKGHGLKHNPLNAIIGPRPIGWISSCDPQGHVNLAPYSFFNAFNYTPPIIGFCSLGWKDSVRNIEATGEFGWNLATRPLAEQMNTTCADVPPEVDEFELAKLEKTPSKFIKPPRVAASPVSFECKLTQLIQLHDVANKPIDSWLVLGEVVAVYIDKQMIRDGIYDTIAAHPILRGGGPADYFAIDNEAQRFLMYRPK